MSNYSKKTSDRRSDDTMDDETDDKDDTKRKSRNLSEKKRRDQFNMLVNELSSMVSTGSRKMDKSTVLRSTITFLKNHNEITIRSRAHEIQEDWKPAFLSNEEFTHLILEALDGFIIVFSAAGHIHYVSESVTALLGHLPNELLNTSVYELVWDEEQAALYQALIGSGVPGSGTGLDGQLSFQAHLRRGGTPTQQNHQNGTERDECYELINFVGYLRTDVDMLDQSTPQTDNSRFTGYSNEADTRLFVGTGRLQTPQLIREMSLVDASDISSVTSIPSLSGQTPAGAGRNTAEFTSRHSLEWKFLFLDHRAPPIIGYLPFEVLGTSGYDYYHVDDLDKVVSCHEALMQKGEGTSCYYRFLTKGQQWIWLQTRFYITYHQWNSKPEFIVCTHRVVSYVDVLKQHRHQSTATSDLLTSPHPLDSSPMPTSTPRSGTSSPWGAASSHRGSATSTTTKGHRHHHPRRTTTGTPSDCTSMSADSPASRQNQGGGGQQVNGGRSTRLSNQTKSNNPSTGQQTNVLYTEPTQQVTQIQIQRQASPQFVTAISVQPAVITSFAPPTATVLSPITTVDNTTLVLPRPDAPGGDPTNTTNITSNNNNNNNNNNLQVQLQRKHAELQAIIGQQQAELRRVSEQLLMARLGLLATGTADVATHQPSGGGHHQPNQSIQQCHQATQHGLLNATVPYICNSNVSSTTTSAPLIVNEVTAVSVPISVSVPIVPMGGGGGGHSAGTEQLLHSVTAQRPPPDDTGTMALSQQQAHMLFTAQNSTGGQQQHK